MPSANPKRILCVGMPVRDLVFHIRELPARGNKVHAESFTEIAGGNALNGAIGIVRLGGKVLFSGPMGDAAHKADAHIFDQLDAEGIDHSGVVHMAGLFAPLSSIMIDPTGERTIVTFRDPALWKVKLPDADMLLANCSAVLTENRCAEFVTDLCAEALRRGIPVVVDADQVMSLSEGMLRASSHLIFSADTLYSTAGTDNTEQALRKNRAADAVIRRRDARPAWHELARSRRRLPPHGRLSRAHGRHPRRRRRVPRQLHARHC